MGRIPPPVFDFAAWRARLGISQAEAARRLGKSRRQVQNYEDQTTPGDRTLSLACRYLEVLDTAGILAALRRHPARHKH